MGEISIDPLIGVEAAGRSEVALARLKSLLGTPKKRDEMAILTGIPAPTLKDYNSGRTSPPVDRFLLIASASRKSPGWFFNPDEADDAAPAIDPEIAARAVMIRVMNVQAAAGVGHFNHLVREIDTMPWPAAFMKKIGADPKMTESIRASGDSMSPTIEDGALLLVDRSQAIVAMPRRPAKGRPQYPDPIFVFVQGDDLRIKRVRRLDRDFLALISDNAIRYPPEILARDEAARVKIIGRVVWWDNRL